MGDMRSDVSTHPAAILSRQNDDGSWTYDETLATVFGIENIFSTIRFSMPRPPRRSKEIPREVFFTAFVNSFLHLVDENLSKTPLDLVLASDPSMDPHPCSSLDDLIQFSASVGSWTPVHGEWSAKAVDYFAAQSGEKRDDYQAKAEEAAKKVIKKNFLSPFNCKECGLYLTPRKLCVLCKTDKKPTGKTSHGGTKWASVFEESKFDFNFKRESVPDLQDVNVSDLCKTIQGVHFAAGGLGSTGVFLIETEKGAVVAKVGSSTSPGEWYCSRLCSHLGIEAPECRFISKDDAELLKEAMGKTAWTKAESRQQLASFTSQTVTLMEFVAGQSFGAIENSDELFEQGDIAMLRKMGRMLLLDLLVNNFDRIPYIWDNPGNPGNLIFRSAEEPVAIDQTVSAILNAAGLKKYEDRVTEALVEVKNHNSKGPRIDNVRAHILRITQHNVEEKGCGALQEGVRDAIDCLAELLKNSTFFEDILTELKEAYAKAGHDPSKQFGIEKVNTEFLKNIASVILDSK